MKEVNEIQTCPKGGWTVRTLVKALLNYELDTPVHTINYEHGEYDDFDVSYKESVVTLD